MTATQWTPERDEKLKELWDDNSADDISHALGCSRRAVYMRVNHLGLKKKVERLPENNLTQDDRDQLVIDNYQFAVWLGSRMKGDRDDNTQTALIGLIKAAKTWDESRGPYSDHAYALMRREFASNRGKMQRRIHEITALDEKGADQFEGSTMKDAIEDDYPSGYEAAFSNDVRGLIGKALDALTDKQRIVALLRLLHGTPLSTIAKYAGTSRQDIYASEKRAYKILRDHISPAL